MFVHMCQLETVCVLVSTLFHIYILLFAFGSPVPIMGKIKNGSLKPPVGQDRGGRGTLGSKAKFVQYMRRNGFSAAETREALKHLHVNKQRRFTLMRDHFHALPEGARTPTPSYDDYLVTMGSLDINGFIPWSAVPVPEPRRSCMKIFPRTKKEMRDRKIAWADSGEEKSHNYPRRSYGRHVRTAEDQELWWDEAHFAMNREAVCRGLCESEIKSCRANPEVPSRN